MLVTNREDAICSVGKQQKNIHIRLFRTLADQKQCVSGETAKPNCTQTSRLPTILSQEEVAQLIDAACTPFHRTILMTLYATGVRNEELIRLKVSDIDSRRMVIHVQGGKGRKDRDVMLSTDVLCRHFPSRVHSPPITKSEVPLTGKRQSLADIL